ncbi:hypothetical protein MPTK1_1g07190 [Marchantia polymorpha subsp. ruderalis]|uniref:Transmembrane protein 209 n=2 Tax=Marchantia polymorpha TaxID=3197 RepID=A0AAF6AMG8_MARPO|nr:hypothetical protein MARPO_0043s0112 [Marchantia polymorpha]BBM97638.1 hypothetical protein Mp_1g07190 [Marchantia polymorpha subsp. ruderalis]|eukprot:PTQ39880.1 hypothetical protein MARPO_0043s0112 [Marchantia polymorpha]
MALRAASPPPAGKFGVYENAAVASALSHQAIRRRPWHFPFILTLCCAACSAVWSIYSRSQALTDNLATLGISQSFAAASVQVALWIVIILFLMTLSALCKVLSVQSPQESHIGVSLRSSGTTTVIGSPISSFASPGSTGFKPLKSRDSPQEFSSATRQRPPRARQSPGQSQSPVLVPIHPSVLKSKPLSSPWSGLNGFTGPVKSPVQKTSASSAPSGSPFQATPFPAPPLPTTPASQLQNSPGSLSFWPNHRTRSGRLDFGKDELDSEKKLAEFLAEVDDKLADACGKSGGQATPSPTVQGVANGPSPSLALVPAPVASTPRTPMRALRMSPSAQKTGSPKKGEVEIPLPMSMEQALEVFKKLGIYPQIEQWRDSLRQWFSDMLLNPLVRKIDSSHLQAMAAAAQLGSTINVSQVGGLKQDTTSVPISADGSLQEWLTTMVPDEDSQLHQLRAHLLQARDGPVSVQQNSLFGLAPPQEKVYNPHIQACLDAVTEHQRLKALIKGEWVKGLLPQSSVRADYTAQRIRDLAEGTCVKAYEYIPNGEVYDKVSKRWTADLPSDAHLLLYLFCALLEHPQWMLHVDPTSYPSTQSGNNSLFVASLPHKERYPEKYIAIISGAPSILQAGATVLAVSKTSPPIFALYWDKKLQFSFQGRSALWDAILLLCYRIKVAHGGVVRGINLGSPAFNLLSVLEPSPESPVK